jgi:glutathionylspermidine synthase
MKRLPSRPRPHWQDLVSKVGLTYHTAQTPQGEVPYWDESACYEFTAAEIEQAERLVHDLHYLLIDAADTIVQKGAYDRLGIPASAVPLIERSWANDDFSLYGRFDLAWMPGGEPKLLEYNADTPTSLVEAAVAQWHWLNDTHPGLDQFNSIHERLIDAWKRYRGLHPGVSVVDFTSVADDLEDGQTISYLMDTAMQAGLRTRWSAIGEIGYDRDHGRFVSAPGGPEPSAPISACFKLYPWEWLVREEFGQYLGQAPTAWLEPAWKALLSNKAILAIAWELYPGHPGLLPTYFTPEPLGRSYVRKPKLSREGSNVTVVRDGATLAETPGEYGEEGYVFQAIADIPDFDGNRPVFGGWVVDHESAGMGVRESTDLVTGNLARFVPHYIRP